MAWLKRNLVLVLTVIVPTVAAILYYGFVASDVFISESRFLVRSPQKQTQGGMFGQLLQGTGLSHSQDDTYSIHDFILSRDALKELDANAAVRKAFASKTIDPSTALPASPGTTVSRSFIATMANTSESSTTRPLPSQR